MSDDDMYDEDIGEEEEEDEEEDLMTEAFDGEAEEDEPETHSSSSKRDRTYVVLDKNDLERERDRLVREAMDILTIPSAAIASALLRKLRWNKERLIDKYAENPERWCAEAGVPYPPQTNPPVVAPNAKFVCLICTETSLGSNSYALSCGHRYCKNCWKDYLEYKIGDGPECLNAPCMYPKCKLMCHDDAYRAIVSPQLYERYKVFSLKSYVDDNPLVKWCPAPGCMYSLRVESRDRREPVSCKCGLTYCWRCNDSSIADHTPCPCEMIAKWMEKASDESENITWLLANTKSCPMCRSPIEKNGGCMHMTCRKNAGGCGFEFCWLCRGPWTEHGSATGGYYSCNKYDASTAKKEDEKAQDVKTELEQYMFYYHRYESHRNAGKVAEEQRRKAHEKEAQILGKFDVRSQDTKFLMEATEQLLHNRKVLQYSYVYGYYLDKKSQERNLFEWLQEDLEKHTNQLSTLYEMPADKIEDYHSFIKWKEQVTNYTRITQKFLVHFVEGVMGGLTQAGQAGPASAASSSAAASAPGPAASGSRPIAAK